MSNDKVPEAIKHFASSISTRVCGHGFRTQRLSAETRHTVRSYVLVQVIPSYGLALGAPLSVINIPVNYPAYESRVIRATYVSPLFKRLRKSPFISCDMPGLVPMSPAKRRLLINGMSAIKIYSPIKPMTTPKNNSSNQQNANKGTNGTNKAYDKAQGNRGWQMNPQNSSNKG